MVIFNATTGRIESPKAVFFSAMHSLFRLQNIKPHQNVDIGPLQKNWKAHGSHSGYPAQYFMNGTFSLLYLSKFILGPIVQECRVNWVNCYNSGKHILGLKYRDKIEDADLVLRRVLAEIIHEL